MVCSVGLTTLRCATNSALLDSMGYIRERNKNEKTKLYK
jgi:hypothetical protein